MSYQILESGGQWTIIYDGDCGFCQWSAERLGKRFSPGSYRMVPRQKAIGLGISPEKLEEGKGKVMLLCSDGKVLGGHLAVLKAYEVTGLGAIARVLAAPPIGWVLGSGYWVIARNRRLISRAFFKNQACRLD